MRTSDFKFDLPEQLIAQQPCKNRADSRLLHLQCAETTQPGIKHLQFNEFPDLINPDDLLVFNNTRVIPARLYGSKSTGGKVEILIERIIDANHALAHVRASKTPKAGSIISLDDCDHALHVDGRQGDLFLVSSNNAMPITEIMEQVGHMPLPPYISREDTAVDFERYQTIYAKTPGAVAAPTAGLHFDEQTLQRLQDKGVKTAYVTLHVGAGTFQPVRADNIEDHQMHSETIEVDQNVVDLCAATREKGGRIIAIGTTSVRALETASSDGQLKSYSGETDIFIYPGYRFRSVDALLTNFHLSESTLLMLVSAFAGRDAVFTAYQEAIDKKYRFFSYGDAMFFS